MTDTTTKRPHPKRGTTPGSITDQLNNLQIGQSVSFSQRFPVGVATEHDGDIKESLTRMRATAGGYVHRLKGMDDLDMREFRVESGAFVTDDKLAIVATVAVSRVE